MTDSPEKIGAKTAGRGKDGKFLPGNPGKPRGARKKSTRAFEAMLHGQAEQLTRAAIDAALAGDPSALRLCIERLAPAPRDAPVPFDLPPMETAADAATAAGAVLAACAAGELTPIEATRVMGLVDAFRRALELTEIEERLAALEAAQ